LFQYSKIRINCEKKVSDEFLIGRSKDIGGIL